MVLFMKMNSGNIRKWLLISPLLLAACSQVPGTAENLAGPKPDASTGTVAVENPAQSTSATDSGLSAQTIQSGDNKLSLEPFVSVVNGWGPVERDRSNGENLAGDGRTLTLQGVTYGYGFGVHSDSQMTFNVGGLCQSFTTSFGVDDEIGDRGSVIFQVFTDGMKVYDSGTMTGASATKNVSIDLTGKSTLKLVVVDSGNGYAYDHADWVNPLLKSCTPTNTPVSAPAVPTDALTPEQFGAKGDGVTDDTTALMSMFRALNSQDRAAAFGAGKTYRFVRTEATQFSITRTGATVYGNGAILKVADGVPTNTTWYGVRIAGANITVQDLTVDANRDRRPALTSSTHQMAWLIDSSRTVTLRRVRGLNAPLDGMYINDFAGPRPSQNDLTYPTDIRLENVEMLNSGRNNLSVIVSKNLSIIGGKFNGAHGVNGIPDGPWAGIDLEPNRSTDLFGNNGVYIEGVETSDNAGPGIAVAQINNKNITIKNHVANRNGTALFLSPSGSISVDGLKASGYGILSKAGVIAIVPSDVSGATLTFRNLVVSNATDSKPIFFQNYPGNVSLDGLWANNVTTSKIVGDYRPTTIANVYRDSVKIQ